MPVELQLGVSIFLGLVGFFLLVQWLRDLSFCFSNGWDFTASSGRRVYYGFLGARGPEMSNRARVIYGYPFLVSGFLDSHF